MLPNANEESLCSRRDIRDGSGGVDSKISERQENVSGGVESGWQVILQTASEKSRAEMQRLGLLNHV